jgi:NAD(P)-dependent dehydrogenase (short-subunit alcohol dehydrogenase family)
MSVTVQAAANWTAASIPDQTGRVAVITGANTGIGLETAKALAGHGATVVLACRDPKKAQEAQAAVAAASPRGEASVVRLDLASLASVRDAAQQIGEQYQSVDLLINNAGLMWPPQGYTADGFELQFGVNHLGHFALTGLLLDRLGGDGARVVTVSSVGHRRGQIDLADPDFRERKYNRTAAYGQSKLANLLFAYELQRRLTAAGAPLASLAAHPGMASTELYRDTGGPTGMIVTVVLKLSGHPVDQAALPSLRAATDPSAAGGQYYGPGGRGETRGFPVVVQSSTLSNDTELAKRLWAKSEELTGVTYSFN